jgi:hypothetical protein
MNIEAVTITVIKSQASKSTRLNSTVDWLTDSDFVKKLHYLEFRGVYQSPENHRFLEFLTKRRPKLEIVFEYATPAVLIRDMARVPLYRVHDSESASTSKAEADDEDAREEDDDDVDHFGLDDDLTSSDPRASERMPSRLGQQAAMNDALGRELYDFKLDEDYGGYHDMLDDDEGIDTGDMRQMMKIMRQMGAGGSGY